MNEEAELDLAKVLQDIGEKLTRDVGAMDSLEIFSNECHLAFKIEQSADMDIFEPYAAYFEMDEQERSKVSSVRYRGVNYALTRIDDSNEDYVTFILISKDAVDGEKVGMVIVADNSGILFIATSKVDKLRLLNAGLLATIFS